MPRRRSNNVNYIANASSRRLTYKKRSKSLLKKVEEVLILCDVKGCAIIYSNNNRNNNELPSTFPENLREDLSVISNFYEMSPSDQTSKMLNQEEYLTEQIQKSCEQFKKLQVDNQETRLTALMQECLLDKTKSLDDLTFHDLIDFSKLVDRNHKEITNLIASKEVVTPPLSLSLGTNNVSGNNINVDNNNNNNNNYGNAPGAEYQWYINNFKGDAGLTAAPGAGQWHNTDIYNIDGHLIAPAGADEQWQHNSNFNMNGTLSAPPIGDQWHISNLHANNIPLNALGADPWHDNDFDFSVPLSAPDQTGQWPDNNNSNINTALNAPEIDQWYIDMMNNSFDSGVGPSNK
ncbi:hypothetical protein vseg_009031 [Gypsophila vaccaria]